MIDPRRQAFAPYLRQLADLMGLRDWRFDIDDEGPSQYEANAVARPRPGRKIMAIDLGASFLESSPESQRQTLVHELLHAHQAPMNEVVRNMVTPEEFEIHKIQMEYATDGIAEAWAKLLPLRESVELPGTHVPSHRVTLLNVPAGERTTNGEC